MFFKTMGSMILSSVMFISPSAFACDSKDCEKAYLAETQKHVDNQVRRAKAERAERVAHSKNRERKAYALYVHMHMMLFGSKPS